MKRVKAFDVNGREIKANDLVKVVNNPEPYHAWLKEGNTLRVSYWQDRSLGKTPYIIVFLRSKGAGKLCSQGLQDIKLEVIGE